MSQTPRRLSAGQVAERLEVSTETVLRWARDGQIRGFQLPSGRWRFDESSIDELIARGTRQKAAS